METSLHLRIGIVLVGLIAIFMGSCDFNLNGPDNGDDVAVSDPALRSALEEALNITSGAPITQEDMLDLTELDMSNRNISDLTGIEMAKNLELLDLTDCAIIDITPIGDLEKLKGLRIGRNGISDITALAKLLNLEWLDASGNRISDITPLAGLKKLTRLVLSDNLISDIGALAGLENLEWLDLIGNAIIDISPLGKYRKLARLFLGENRIKNITAIFDLESLEWLDLSANLIEAFLPFVPEGIISDNVIRTASTVYSKLKKLKRLNLSNNLIKDLSRFDWLENLEWLAIGGNSLGEYAESMVSSLVNKGVEVVRDVVTGVGKDIARGIGNIFSW